MAGSIAEPLDDWQKKSSVLRSSVNGVADFEMMAETRFRMNRKKKRSGKKFKSILMK